MSNPGARRDGRLAGARIPGSGGHSRAWILLAIAAVAAAVVIVVLGPVGQRYGQFVSSAFGGAKPTCASPGDLTRMATGDIESSVSPNGSTLSYRFSMPVDLRLVCVGNSGVRRITVTTDGSTRSMPLTGTAQGGAPALEEVAVDRGRTSTVTLHIDAPVQKPGGSMISSVRFYAAS